jgi:hypothetical protein
MPFANAADSGLLLRRRFGLMANRRPGDAGAPAQMAVGTMGWGTGLKAMLLIQNPVRTRRLSEGYESESRDGGD